jgi:hypothetical protein
MILRKCGACKIELELNLENFHKEKRNILSFSTICKKCRNEDIQNYRKLNREAHNARNRNAYHKLKNKKEYNNRKYNLHKKNSSLHKVKLKQTIEGVLKYLLINSKHRANKHKIEFNLTYEDLLTLYNDNNGCCKLTGICFDLEKNNEKFKNYKFYPTAISLDKIDSFKGYTKDNVRLVICAMNIALHQYGTDFFESMICAYITKNRDKEIFKNL